MVAAAETCSERPLARATATYGKDALQSLTGNPRHDVYPFGKCPPRHTIPTLNQHYGPQVQRTTPKNSGAFVLYRKFSLTLYDVDSDEPCLVSSINAKSLPRWTLLIFFTTLALVDLVPGILENLEPSPSVQLPKGDRCCRGGHLLTGSSIRLRIMPTASCMPT